jgi:hypothetical protein
VGPCDVYEVVMPMFFDAVVMKDRLCNGLIRNKACFNLLLTDRQVVVIVVVC